MKIGRLMILALCTLVTVVCWWLAIQMFHAYFEELRDTPELAAKYLRKAGSEALIGLISATVLVREIWRIHKERRTISDTKEPEQS